MSHVSMCDETGGQEATAVPRGMAERWSAAWKTRAVLRLLRGEAIEIVSRDTQVSASQLEEWRRVFLESGMRGFTAREGKPGQARPRTRRGAAVDPLEQERYWLEVRKRGPAEAIAGA